MLDERKVAISEMENRKNGYSKRPPFFPPVIYPELRHLNIELKTDESNQTYEAVRNAFILLGLDAENIGSENWNP